MRRVLIFKTELSCIQTDFFFKNNNQFSNILDWRGLILKRCNADFYLVELIEFTLHKKSL